MRQAVWLVVGLMLVALGAQGAIVLLINHNPSVLRWVPGGYFVQLAAYAVMIVLGLRLARHNRVRPDVDRD
ncbi:hypothetical protein [Actinoplanes sp. HUAS TT8]|uniref:hypothetical protein n=1 Tax=Actinoplanes sp. HUAS TT8 TaxID=3447453 RepID=UPI003F51F1AE